MHSTHAMSTIPLFVTGETVGQWSTKGRPPHCDGQQGAIVPLAAPPKAR